jgi:S1-C subfamily serine protease
LNCEVCVKKSERVIMALAMLGVFSARPLLGAQDVFRQSLVKIYATIKGPDWSQPWQMVPQSKMFGSGFIIAGKRIMTNAHLVANQMNLRCAKRATPSATRPTWSSWGMTATWPC